MSTFRGEDHDPGEACDQGAANAWTPGALCRPDCSRSRCGDGVLDPGEACDDGNLVDGDDCDPRCARVSAAAPATLPAAVIDLPFVLVLGGGSDVGVLGGNPFATVLPQPSLAASNPHAPVGDTGPAAVLVLALGGAAGWAWIRRRR